MPEPRASAGEHLSQMPVPPMSRTDRASARARRLQWPYPRGSTSTENVVHCSDYFERQPAPPATARLPRLRLRPCTDFASSCPSSVHWTELGRAYARPNRPVNVRIGYARGLVLGMARAEQTWVNCRVEVNNGCAENSGVHT